MRCAVIGGGAWGTALAHVLGTNGHEVTLWAREPEVVVAVNSRHENTVFLAGARLSPGVKASSDMRATLADARIVMYAVPSAHLREIAKRAAPIPAPIPAAAPARPAARRQEHRPAACRTK